jgi:uncharacterized PurR-regulated membrane protein YhhQ (DUF165 family)
MTTKAAGTLLGYVAAIVTANLMTSEFGLVHGVAAGTLAAGASFIARDAVQDTAGRRWAVAAIVAGAGLSAVLSGAQLAAASGAAFLVSELLDMAIYTPLRRRGYIRAALASNSVGAAIDSALFLSLAGFGATVANVSTQWLVKMALTAVAVLAVRIVRERRAVLRDSLDTAGA